MTHEVGVEPVAVQVLGAEPVRRLRDQLKSAGPPAQPRNACYEITTATNPDRRLDESLLNALLSCSNFTAGGRQRGALLMTRNCAGIRTHLELQVHRIRQAG